MDKKKVANNILEFLLDPTVIPIRQRLYFRPEERLDNRVYDQAKLDVMKAYRTQRQNADMYPSRNRTLTQQEDFRMDRRTLVASLDILSQNFVKDDPIARDLRTMAYAVSKMSGEELSERVAEEGPDFGLVEAKRKKTKTVKCPQCGKDVMEQTHWCFKCKKDINKMKKKAAEETGAPSEEAVPAEETAPEKKEVDASSYVDGWNEEASNAVARAILADVKGMVASECEEKTEKKPKEEIDAGAAPKAPVEAPAAPAAAPAEEAAAPAEESDKKAGKIKPGVPDATGPASETGECPRMKQQGPEEKESTVNTDILATDLNPSESIEIDGVQFAAQTISADQVDMSDDEKKNLDAVFGFSLNMTDEEKDRYSQLYR